MVEQLNYFSEMEQEDILLLEEGAYQVGLSSFDISVYSENLKFFLENLTGNGKDY